MGLHDFNAGAAPKETRQLLMLVCGTDAPGNGFVSFPKEIFESISKYPEIINATSFQTMPFALILIEAENRKVLERRLEKAFAGKVTLEDDPGTINFTIHSAPPLQPK